ncbi:hypothetical protein GGI59_006311 [Rhizobium lentis]|uniref:Uncharacterized protein n=1 Tax=Rhizobium lentis TaxID=1138194 RepID=A0A7W8XKK6_9HYPH|nr:hypothetical protein [Rhizobium lentis]MBB5554038.1 hypothetical protein [Rhizobium lentis]MBB5564602.1 hypothetical protein [Rhizobium lentis]MBB5571150.1 hypothetical protein [Rhizobium lentis]
MTPTQQRLEADDSLRHLHQRLIFDEELPLLEGHTQTAPQRLTLLQHDHHREVERSRPAASIVLGSIERDVGCLHQLFAVIAIGRRNGNSHACADKYIDPVDGEWLFERADQGSSQVFGLRRLIPAPLNDGEFVARKSVGGFTRREVSLGSVPPSF